MLCKTLKQKCELRTRECLQAINTLLIIGTIFHVEIVANPKAFDRVHLFIDYTEAFDKIKVSGHSYNNRGRLF